MGNQETDLVVKIIGNSTVRKRAEGSVLVEQSRNVRVAPQH